MHENKTRFTDEAKSSSNFSALKIRTSPYTMNLISSRTFDLPFFCRMHVLLWYQYPGFPSTEMWSILKDRKLNFFWHQCLLFRPPWSTCNFHLLKIKLLRMLNKLRAILVIHYSHNQQGLGKYGEIGHFPTP